MRSPASCKTAQISKLPTQLVYQIKCCISKSGIWVKKTFYSIFSYINEKFFYLIHSVIGCNKKFLGFCGVFILFPVFNNFNDKVSN